LSSITSITIDGLSAEFELVGDEIRLVIPMSLKPGTHDIVVQSDSGRLLIQAGLVVKRPVVTGKASTRVKILDGKVKLYAENIVGAGKVQFFVNGREVAWVRATSISDSKVRFANGIGYLVRTVPLAAGNNEIEIRFDGVLITRTAYSK
jgi:hypothetical protein